MSRTAVVAYSGGLDTSCILAWLKEDYYGFDEVIAAIVDVGQEFDLEESLARANAAQADDVVLLDRQDDFADEQCARAIITNALYEGKYPLVSALSRPVIAGAVAEIALDSRGRGGRARVHGEGKRPAPLRARVQGPLSGRDGDRAAARPRVDARRGDRVRARQGHSRDPDGRVSVLDRREPLRALDRGGHPGGPVERAAGGAIRIHLRSCDAPLPIEIVVGFEQGIPVALDGEELSLAELIGRLNRLAGRVRDRSDRHGREPCRRHQEPRGVRGACGSDARAPPTPRSRTSS